MKINELLYEEEQIDELAPGQVPGRLDPRRYFGQGKRNAQTVKQDKMLAKNLYNAWNGYAVRLNRALANDPDLVPKSAQYFKSFISKALKISPGNPMFQEIDNMLGVNGVNYNKATAQKALDYAVAQRAIASLQPPNAPAQAAGAPAQATAAPAQAAPAAATPNRIKTGAQRKSSNGQTYKIVRLKNGSREWHDLAGNRAADSIQQELGKKYGV